MDSNVKLIWNISVVTALRMTLSVHGPLATHNMTFGNWFVTEWNCLSLRQPVDVDLRLNMVARLIKSAAKSHGLSRAVTREVHLEVNVNQGDQFKQTT